MLELGNVKRAAKYRTSQKKTYILNNTELYNLVKPLTKLPWFKDIIHWKRVFYNSPFMIMF
jgi:hypothetical protein